METVSSREFMAHADRYLEMAVDRDVIIQKEGKMFRIVYEPHIDEQPALEPDEDFYNAITGEELKRRMRLSIHNFFADKQ